MIDGIKILHLPVNVEVLTKNNALVFPLSNVSIDGEYIDRAQVAEYMGIRFILKNNNAKLLGSLHKYYNKGLHNHNDFYVSDLLTVINEICEKFSFEAKETELNGVEFGLNLKTPCSPQTFIDSIINYKGTPFERMDTNGKGHGRECIKNTFIIKCYDKSLQYSLPENIMRFEIKAVKMRFFEDNGINLKTLYDLKNVTIYPGLSSILKDCFNELLVYNQSTDISNLSDKERGLILQGSNPLYWTERRKNIKDSAKRKSYQRELSQFKTLTESIGGNKYKNEISNLIESKCKDLLNVPFSPINECPIFTDVKQNENSECPKFTFKINCEKWTPPKLYLLCPITKHRLNNQKPGSKFLSIRGLKYLLETDKIKFELLRNERLTRKWRNEPLEVQIREVAHSIRNEYYNPKNNPRNNTKRAINNIYKDPILFDFCEYIRPEKKELVEMQCN